MTLTNDRPGIGHNDPGSDGAAERVTAQLNDSYGELLKNVDALLDEAREAPKSIESDEQMQPVIGLIKRLKDAAKRCESHHDAEKSPHLRAGEAVDGFFFKVWEKLARRKKADKPGAADVLQARVHDYQERKLEVERARRQREADEAARKEQAARAESDRLAREAEEKRLAAERARKPEKVEEKTAAAQQAEGKADLANVNAMIAGDASREAEVAAKAKPADIVRTRTDEGMATMGREAYAEVIDYDKLDRDKLWMFVDRKEIDKALRAWARTTGHKEMMDGASIGHRNKTNIR